MEVNFERLVTLMLPIRLRKSKVLLAIVKAMSCYTKKKYEEERKEVLKLLEELRYTSQMKSFQYLLNKVFDEKEQRIYITDQTQTNVSLVKEDELDGSVTMVTTDEYADDYVESLKFLALKDEDTNIGEDFVVHIPDTVDKDKIKGFIDKYVFYGVGYSISYN